MIYLPSSPGTVTKVKFEDGKMIVKREQDCEKIVERNKESQKETHKGHFRPVAEIPFVIIEKWMREDGVPWFALNKKAKTDYLRRKLRDPDWKYMKAGKL